MTTGLPFVENVQVGGALVWRHLLSLALTTDASKEDGRYRNPFTGALSKVVALKRGGTGYAGNTDQSVVAKKEGQGFVLG